jgi:mannose-1-phosphate guanylyltransferase
MYAAQPWAIVLAAGEGSRLSGLTTDAAGCVVPKQFCSLRGGRSLLGDAIERARSFAPSRQIVVVVAAHHRRFWERDLEDFAPENVVVQPSNRGTAAGVLLPLMTVLERDPHANVAVLPSDHFVLKEAVLATALHVALDALADDPRSLTLLGITPDAPEPDYGWIVPEPCAAPLHRVRTFVEKPSVATAHRLASDGGLWNSFLFAARGLTLASLYDQLLPELFDGFEAAFEGPTSRREPALDELYRALEPTDFSRDVLQAATARLRVLEVPTCGWTDLGTPRRVAECLRQLPRLTDTQLRARPLDLNQRLAALPL